MPVNSCGRIVVDIAGQAIALFEDSRLLALHFQAIALGDIPDGADDQTTAIRLDRAQVDLYGNFLSSLPMAISCNPTPIARVLGSFR